MRSGPTLTSAAGTSINCFETAHEVLRVGGQVIERATVGGGGLPAPEFLVDGARLLQVDAAGGEDLDALVVDLVRDADLEGLEVIQDVEAGEGDAWRSR